MIHRRGLMLVLSSPSGAGKSSLSRQLLAADDNLKLSISITTRKARPAEKEGRDYFFVDEPEFNRMVHDNTLLEFAKVFGHYYGTPKDAVETALKAGQDVLFDIDWQGTQQIAEKAREDLVTVFILPPSTAELERRLRERAQDPGEVVEARMAKAADEMSHYAEYDYIVVNDEMHKSTQQILAILTAERLRRDRQEGLVDFVKQLRTPE